MKFFWKDWRVVRWREREKKKNVSCSQLASLVPSLRSYPASSSDFQLVFSLPPAMRFIASLALVASLASFGAAGKSCFF